MSDASSPAKQDQLGGALYINGSQTLIRYGQRPSNRCWLWRMVRIDPEFPQPIVIGGRNYWRVSELEAWERNRESKRGPRPVLRAAANDDGRPEPLPPAA